MSRSLAGPRTAVVAVAAVVGTAVAGAARGDLPTRLTTVAPQQLAQATIGATLQLVGTGLKPGIVIRPAGDGGVPGAATAITFTPVLTLSSAVASTTVTVAKTALPGRYAFVAVLSMADGQAVPIGKFFLVVVPRSSLVAPISVTEAAVVYPLEGALVGEGEELRPRALLGTTGSGPIMGYWELDGVPFERFVVSARAGLPVDVGARAPVPRSSLGSHLVTLRIDSPQALTSAAVRIVAVTSSPPSLRLVVPRDGDAVSPDTGGGGPSLRWTAVAGAVAYEVILATRPEEEYGVLTARTAATSWYLSREAWAGLGPGYVWWTVRPIFAGEQRGAAAPWRALELLAHTSATAGALGSQWRLASATLPPSESVAASGSPAALLDWRADLSAAITATDEKDAPSRTEARLPAALSLAWQEQGRGADVSADLSFLQELHPDESTTQESRSYVVRGHDGGASWSVGGAVGYFGPSGIDGARLLAGGTVRGGAEADLDTPAGKVSVYGSYDSAAGTSRSAGSDPQRLRIASWSAPFDASSGSLRVTALEARADDGATAGLARSLGILGGLGLGGGWRLEIEGAHSRLEDEATSTSTGDAVRLGVTGELLGGAVALALLHTGASFVNPASGSLDLGGVNDRDAADLTLARNLGSAALSLACHYAASGEGESGDGAAARHHGLDASLDTPLGARLRLVLAATYGHSSAGASQLLPAMTVTTAAANASVSGTWGGLTATQALTWQSTRNSGNPAAEASDLDVMSATLTLGGAPGAELALAGNASWTRSDAAIGEARTSLLLSLQPSWSRPAVGVTFGPVLSAAWDEVPGGGRQRLLQAQMTLAWNPPPEVRCPVGVSVSGSWRETTVPELITQPAQTARGWEVSASLVWRGGGGSAEASAAAAPVATPTVTAWLGDRGSAPLGLPAPGESVGVGRAPRR